MQSGLFWFEARIVGRDANRPQECLRAQPLAFVRTIQVVLQGANASTPKLFAILNRLEAPENIPV